MASESNDHLQETTRDLAHIVQLLVTQEHRSSRHYWQRRYIEVLRMLSEAGPLKVGDLVKSLNVLPAQMSRILDRMEREKLVLRVIHPKDKRSFRIEATGEGSDLLENHDGAFLSFVAKAIRDLDLPDDVLAVCHEALARVRHQLRTLFVPHP